NFAGNSVPMNIRGGLGRQQIYPMLAAYCVGLSQNLNIVKMNQAARRHVTPRGRMKLVVGIKETTIIDDTYNSSPVAVREALETLKLVKTSGRKIAVLGDMLELGKFSFDAHEEAGKHASKIVDVLMTVGVRARQIADGALDGGLDENNVYQFDEAREAGRFLQDTIKSGDVILIKGSQSIRMERTVEEIMAFPEEAEKTLVRQDRLFSLIGKYISLIVGAGTKR
ncbi:hypothetical protein KW783_03180, partial [Candidatus Parcubacteria bacterium]|nr:hypothetical protein [Candidatus Parcubacteria bacterium]